MLTDELLFDSEQLNTALQAERQALQAAKAEIARLQALLERK
ncbi:MAG: hypothetical protein U1F76_14545 [Candidatus Competibacteraceae bacterium]